MKLTFHAAERYYQRILKEPVPEIINLRSEMFLKIETGIINAYLKYEKLFPLLKGKIQVDIRTDYRAVVQDNKIITITRHKNKKMIKEQTNRRKQNSNKIKNDKMHGYKYGKKVYGHRK